ncbi:hypothetical protein NDU88_005519 [Pleurodeles waltl]|uniref:Uncharacterized protein n=1 Tax=Pleurodeles waltl TaxID=8319 RepID=A0AAV7WY36_PLEWA|nr:hypothetical protein NDU88_005519 [Pleurodeles waltl]
MSGYEGMLRTLQSSLKLHAAPNLLNVQYTIGDGLDSSKGVRDAKIILGMSVTVSVTGCRVCGCSGSTPGALPSSLRSYRRRRNRKGEEDAKRSRQSRGLKTPYVLVPDCQQKRSVEGRWHRKLKERKLRMYSWTATDPKDRTRSKTAVQRIAAQKKREDTQKPATFRKERGHLRYQPLRKWRTGQSGGGTKKREAGGGKEKHRHGAQ